MKVWLLRTSDYSKVMLDELCGRLNAFEGPIDFICNDSEVLKKIIVNGLIEPENALKIISDFRKAQKISKSDFICLYTNTRLTNNFFTYQDLNRNFIIHSGDWEQYTHAGNIYPDAYLLYSNILKTLVYEDKEDGYKAFHVNESIGCYMDFCMKKKDILLQLRTADICDKCLQDIQNQGIDGRYLGQIIDAFEGLRLQLLFKNRLEIDTKPSRLVITEKGKFILPDYGNIEFKFSPLRKAIYKLFLESEDGYTFPEVIDEKEKLLELYKTFQHNKTDKELRATIEKFCNPHSNSIWEDIAKINTEIVKQVGERISVHYVIDGERGGKRRINYKYK